MGRPGEGRREAAQVDPFCSFSRMRIVRQDGREIVDYSGQDYREFWRGAGKTILDRLETGLVRGLVGKHLKPGGGWFVDLGCGYGRTLPAYYREDRRIVLVDYAVNNLQAARSRYADRPNVFYVAADAYRLPFREAAFESGVAVRMFQHLNRPEEFLAGLARVVSPGGGVLLTYFNGRNLRRPFSRLTHVRMSPAYYRTHPRYFRRLCGENGFTVRARAGAGTFFRLMQNLRWLGRYAESHPRQVGLLGRLSSTLDFPLGRLSLSVHQFDLLRKEGACAPAEAGEGIAAILECPRCGESRLERGERAFLCGRCWAVYPVVDGILDFRIDIRSEEEEVQP